MSTLKLSSSELIIMVEPEDWSHFMKKVFEGNEKCKKKGVET